MDLELTGKRVLITGGSRGIGLAITKAFLNEGARVAICARDQTGLVAAAAELGAFGEVHHRPADIGVVGEPAALVDWAVDTLGGLDVLVSNVSAMAGPDWEASCAVDLVGTDALIRSALGHMQDDTGANIICIGSRAASTGAPRIPAYAAVKAATVSMIKSLSREIARRGIRANVGLTWGHHLSRRLLGSGPHRRWQALEHDSAREPLSAALVNPRRSQTWLPSWPAPALAS